MAVSERQLLARVRAGDAGACAELVDTHMAEAYDYLWMLTQNRDRAADLTQDTMIQVWKNLDRFRADARLSTWIKKIALNEYRQFLRQSKRRDAEVSCEAIEAADDVDIAEFVADLDRRRFVRDAVANLPPIYREVVVMHCYGGAQLKQVAKALGIPIGTVKWRMSRAIEILKARIAAVSTVEEAKEIHDVESSAASAGAGATVDAGHRRVFIRR